MEQLPQLSRLTRLKLVQQGTNAHTRTHSVGDYDDLAVDAVEQLLQRLTGLERLTLSHPGDTDTLPVVPPASLTRINWDGRYRHPDCGSWEQSVQLQTLKLHNHTVSAAALASLPQLLHLQLYRCCLEGDVSALLAALGGMRQLQHLTILSREDVRTVPFKAAHPRDCAALTASSKLTALELALEAPEPLPATALQYMFAAGRQLPQLRVLRLRSDERWRNEDAAGWVSTADLRSIISACPALWALDVTGVMQAGTDVSVLLSLPAACRHLCVGGNAFGDEAALTVARMTHLTFLE